MTFKYKVQPEELPKIEERLRNGDTYQKIADDYGLSRERIRQFAKRFNLNGYGLKERSREKNQKWLEKMQAKYGEFFDGERLQDKDFLAVCKQKYRQKKALTKSVGHHFDVAFSEIIWNKVCPILGIELDYNAEGRQENSPSFDRIDPEKGYIDGNVQIVSWRANRIKNDGTAEEHYLIWQYLSSSNNK